MSRKRVTMMDVANHLNVSVGLVSQVLAGKAKEHRISAHLAVEVEETASVMGYEVNRMARALRTGKSGIIGLIVADIANPYFGKMARTIENAAFELGYQVMVGSSDENPLKLRKLIRVFLSRQVDGLVVVPVRQCRKELEMINNETAQMVLIDRYCEAMNETAFCGDNQQGGYLLTKHLLKQGYTNPVAFTFDQELSNNIDRIKGYQRALFKLADDQKSAPVVEIVPENAIAGELIPKLEEIIKRGHDSIFFANHALAIEALKHFQKLELNLPDDIGIVSFDNPESFELHQPGITCYEQPLKRICTIAVDDLHTRINGGSPTKDQVNLVKGRLIVRGSTKIIE